MPEYYLVTLFLWFYTIVHCLEAQTGCHARLIDLVSFMQPPSTLHAAVLHYTYISHRPQLCCTVCWMILATQKGMEPNQYLCSLQMFRPLWRPLLSWSTAPMLQTLESHFFQRTSTLPTSSLMSSHCEAHNSALICACGHYNTILCTEWLLYTVCVCVCVSICVCLYAYCACTSMDRCIWSNLCTCVWQHCMWKCPTLFAHPLFAPYSACVVYGVFWGFLPCDP